MQYQHLPRVFTLLVFALLVGACTSVPERIKPVSNFDKQRYLGQWYEIARLDHSFERGLSQVTANYSVRDDGGIKVVNKGYNEEEGEWTEAIGKAYFVSDSTVGHLKVSFFGPFYASYVIAELDPNYQYALITGPDTEYLWILSREPHLAKETIEKLLDKATKAGFELEELIYVEHTKLP